MATVYSLICWGGRTGKTVSISASTDVVTLTNHGLRNGAKLWPSGTLPAELNTSTPIYSRSTGANTFTLHASEAGALANTGQITFNGSSTYAAVVLKSDLVASPSTALTAYGLSDLSRWGDAGSERIYDGRVSWNAGRAAASAFDTEVCECGEGFNDTYTGSFGVTIPAASVTMTSYINGVRSAGFHNGVIGNGYVAAAPNGGYTALSTNLQNFTAEGFSCAALSTSGSGIAISTSSRGGNKIRNMIVFGASTSFGTGINPQGALTKVEYCLVVGLQRAISTASYGYGTVIASNTIVGNGTGIYAENSGAQTYGLFYNNVVYGNAANWSRAAPANIEGANKNTGQSGDSIAAWVVGTGNSSVTISSSDFVNYAGGDYRPSATSLLVDSGADYYNAPVYDLAGDEVPNYNNGGAESRDIGCFEYDHGYGPHPASATISLTSIVSGSRVLITKASDGTVLYNDVPGTSLSFSTTHIGDFNVVVRKATASPFYREFNASGTTVADQTTAIKCLQQLDE